MTKQCSGITADGEETQEQRSPYVSPSIRSILALFCHAIKGKPERVPAAGSVPQVPKSRNRLFQKPVVSATGGWFVGRGRLEVAIYQACCLHPLRGQHHLVAFYNR